MSEERPIVVEPTVNKDLVSYDYLVIDKSGSMQRVYQSTLDGINKYIRDLKESQASTGLVMYASISFFDDTHQKLFEFIPVQELRELTATDYVLGNLTALNDALGFAIEGLKTRLGDKVTSDDVDVTITLFTDGDENASVKYPGHSNNELTGYIKELENAYKWTVAYVGAGTEEEVKTSASIMGVNASNVLNYVPSAAGNTYAFEKMSKARSSKTMSFAACATKSAVSYFVDPGNTSDGFDTGSNTSGDPQGTFADLTNTVGTSFPFDQVNLASGTSNAAIDWANASKPTLPTNIPAASISKIPTTKPKLKKK